MATEMKKSMTINGPAKLMRAVAFIAISFIG